MAEEKDSKHDDDSLKIEDVGIPLDDFDGEPIPLEEEIVEEVTPEAGPQAPQPPETDDDDRGDRNSREDGDLDAIYSEILEDQEVSSTDLALGAEAVGQDDGEAIDEAYDEELDNGVLPLSELEEPRDAEPAGADSSRDPREPPPESVTLDQLSQKLDDLSRDFQSKLKYDAHKEKIIDTLHQELQGYKQNLVRKLLMNTFKDIIKIIDDIKKMAQHFKTNQTLDRDPSKILGFLEAVPSDLEDVLVYQGVNPYSSSGDEFDPSRQRVMNRIPTDNPDQDKTIAEHLRPGYEHETHVIRPELVDVYIFEDKEEKEDNPETR